MRIMKRIASVLANFNGVWVANYVGVVMYGAFYVNRIGKKNGCAERVEYIKPKQVQSWPKVYFGRN